MTISQLFSENKKVNKEFFKISPKVQQYFDLKKQEENLGDEMADRIVDKILKNTSQENKKEQY